MISSCFHDPGIFSVLKESYFIRKSTSFPHIGVYWFRLQEGGSWEGTGGESSLSPLFLGIPSPYTLP